MSQPSLAGAPRDQNRDDNLGFFFDASVARLPDKVAIIDLFGGQVRQLTYAQLDARMDQVARLLTRLGVRAGERIAMIVGNRSEFVEIFFGAMRMGAIPLLLNTRLAKDTLAALIAEAECVAAFIDPACNRDAQAAAQDTPRRIMLDETPDGWRAYESEMALSQEGQGGPGYALPQITPTTQAFQPYTSGSTGRPKGAIMTHSGMLWYIHYNQRHWPAPENERGMVALPLFHKNALRGTVKPMLYAGGSFVIMPAYEPKAYLTALAEHKCTYSRGVAAVFTMFLQHKDMIESLDLSVLKSMSIGSAVVAPELLELVERTLPWIKLSESYGLTEGGSPLRAPVDGRPVPRGSVGVPTPEVELKLIGPDGCESATDGELLIRCPYVCLGYFNEPEITKAKLVDGYLRTGDVFTVDKDGFYYFVSRVDDMFSCGGENVYPKEVENLLFAHPDVVNAVVAAVPHAVKGFVPAALVIPREGSGVTADVLKAYCLAKGPAYSHPRHIEVTSALPLNGAGKIDRNIAKARLEEAYRATGVA